MTDSKKQAVELIRLHGDEIKRLAQYGDKEYRAKARTILEIAGEAI
jgi:hypothetical protein